MSDDDYTQKLEKIIDKQDGLLNHYDAKFNQQNSLNDALSNQNKILKEDLQKHKNLLKDMKKNLGQHKNVINKLKKELEEQLKIQQDLHKNYGEVIKELTDELELQEKQKEAIQGRINQIPNKTTSSNSNKVKLPPRENESNHVSDAVGLIKDKSKEVIEEISDNQKPTSTIHNQQNVSTQGNHQNNNDTCPKCGSKIDDSFIFCDACGYKLK